MQRMKRISKNDPIFATGKQSGAWQTDFGMILAVAVPKKRKINNKKNKRHEKIK